MQIPLVEQVWERLREKRGWSVSHKKPLLKCLQNLTWLICFHVAQRPQETSCTPPPPLAPALFTSELVIQLHLLPSFLLSSKTASSRSLTGRAWVETRIECLQCAWHRAGRKHRSALSGAHGPGGGQPSRSQSEICDRGFNKPLQIPSGEILLSQLGEQGRLPGVGDACFLKGGLRLGFTRATPVWWQLEKVWP